ncbi:MULTISPECIES: site-specific DNA-methyltransferase [Vagococcus]|uniref:DNA methylase N-4/N-6 domain-containing protein n=1 Tax=Vagococcus fluvialis bH819 TaxID=1255619 RepID=A0A1X6WQ28_9ENTE|nr:MULTISPECIES: site-specific DNA-methyltransferase [Vagococcus]SLM86367.1 hypothetical protein FM121_09770 [Vagococcus fluvialis bH819]HCM89021.1 site-specific DNA-methyltransferase [Vagococcus sp.]
MEDSKKNSLYSLGQYSTVFSSYQKKQVYNAYKEIFDVKGKITKKSNQENMVMIKQEFSNLTSLLRRIRNSLYRRLELEYVIYNDLKQDVYGKEDEHNKRLDKILQIILDDFFSEFIELPVSLELKYIWFNRCSKKNFTKEDKIEYLTKKNEDTRKNILEKYSENNFVELVEYFNSIGENNFFIQIIVNYFEEIYKFIFITRPYLYPSYDYQKSIPFDEYSEDVWFYGEHKNEEENTNYTSIIPRELEDYLLEDLGKIMSSSKEKVGAGEQNLIINADFETLHKNLPDDSIDIVLTDPPYFINYAENDWDDELDEKGRYEFFTDYFKSLIPKLKSEATILIFNDYSNIEIIEKSLQIAYAENYYDSVNDGNLEDSKEEWIDSLMKDSLFTILPYLEWAKTNPRPSVHFNKQSEYVITAVSGYKKFETMLGLYDYTALRKAKVDGEFIDELVEESLDYETLLDNLTYENLDTIDESFEESSEIYNSIFSPSAYQIDDIIHDTPKPAPMLNKLLKRYAKPGMTVLDSFSGSGAISISAYELGLNSIACERDDYMTIVSKNRFADFSRLIGRKIIKLTTKESKVSLPNYYTYGLYKEGIANYFYTPINRISSKEERAEFLQERLLEIKRKGYSPKRLSLIKEELSFEDQCFLIGFNELYNTKEFHIIFGESGRNKKFFFNGSDDKRHAVNLACRYFDKFKQGLYAGEFIVDLYDCSFAFKNWKNLNKVERNIRVEKYVKYLHHLISDLLSIETKILNCVKDIKLISMDDDMYKVIYNYFFTLTLATKYYYRLILELEYSEKKGFINDKEFKSYRFSSKDIENSSELILLNNLLDVKNYTNNVYREYGYQKNNTDIKLKPSLDAIEYYFKNIKTKHVNEELLNPINVMRNITNKFNSQTMKKTGINKDVLKNKTINKDGSISGGGNLVSLQSNLYIKNNDRQELIKKIKLEKVKIDEDFQKIIGN